RGRALDARGIVRGERERVRALDEEAAVLVALNAGGIGRGKADVVGNEVGVAVLPRVQAIPGGAAHRPPSEPRAIRVGARGGDEHENSDQAEKPGEACGTVMHGKGVGVDVTAHATPWRSP